MRLERRLIERARGGDTQAIEGLYRRYARTLRGVAFRLTASRADADDIVHDVFAGLPQTLATFEETGSLEGWLRKGTANLALMAVRRRQIRGEVPLPDELRDPCNLEEKTLDGIAAHHALLMLPEHLRVAFVLREVEGYAHREIGEMLGISVSNSMVRAHRAKQQLRTFLAEAP